MLEIENQRQAKNQEAGPGDLNEAILKRGRSLHSTSTNRATEIERSGDPERIRLAALRLKNSERPQKVLQVPHSHVPLAVYTMWQVGASGTVKNLSGTKAVRVRKQASPRPTATGHTADDVALVSFGETCDESRNSSRQSSSAGG